MSNPQCIKLPTWIQGSIMLGYTKEDLDNMIFAIAVALGPHPKLTDEERVNLNKAQDFLEGLWAEGYFD